MWQAVHWSRKISAPASASKARVPATTVVNARCGRLDWTPTATTIAAISSSVSPSRSSADQVAAELDSQAYRAVAIELYPSRFDALTRPDRLAELVAVAEPRNH